MFTLWNNIIVQRYTYSKLFLVVFSRNTSTAVAVISFSHQLHFLITFAGECFQPFDAAFLAFKKLSWDKSLLSYLMSFPVITKGIRRLKDADLVETYLSTYSFLRKQFQDLCLAKPHFFHILSNFMFVNMYCKCPGLCWVSTS